MVLVLKNVKRGNMFHIEDMMRKMIRMFDATNDNVKKTKNDYKE